MGPSFGTFLVSNSIKFIYIGGSGPASGSALNSYPHQSLEICNTVNTRGWTSWIPYGLSNSKSALPEVSSVGEAHCLSISQLALPEVSPAGEAGHGLTISQSALPEVSPAGESDMLDMTLQSVHQPYLKSACWRGWTYWIWPYNHSFSPT
jgi:hypothetical protein